MQGNVKPEWLSGLAGLLPPNREQGNGKRDNIRQLVSSVGSPRGQLWELSQERIWASN